jgi:hypothetical protein
VNFLLGVDPEQIKPENDQRSESAIAPALKKTVIFLLQKRQRTKRFDRGERDRRFAAEQEQREKNKSVGNGDVGLNFGI